MYKVMPLVMNYARQDRRTTNWYRYIYYRLSGLSRYLEEIFHQGCEVRCGSEMSILNAVARRTCVFTTGTAQQIWKSIKILAAALLSFKSCLALLPST